MKGILITGADGYLGLRLATEYARCGGRPLLLWIHAKDEQEFLTKKARLANQLQDRDGQVSYFWGDLTWANPFEGINPSDVGTILHAAAIVRFNVAEDAARQVNVEGTRRLLRLAERCTSLDAFGLISTMYVSGLRSGVIAEAPMDDAAGFANYYEWSKWRSENILLSEFNILPWRIFRIATVIADGEDGQVVQHNAVHNTLKLLYHGLISLVPGNPQTPLYFVTREFVAEAVYALMHHPGERVIYHLAHRKEDSVALDELIDIAFSAFGESQDFTGRRILRPLYTDFEAFQRLVEGVTGFGGPLLQQAVTSVAPFAKQLFTEKDIQNRNLIASYPGYRAPGARQLVHNTCRHLVQAKWGRETA